LPVHEYAQLLLWRLVHRRRLQAGVPRRWIRHDDRVRDGQQRQQGVSLQDVLGSLRMQHVPDRIRVRREPHASRRPESPLPLLEQHHGRLGRVPERLSRRRRRGAGLL
jgi:hypothetical protein